MNLNADLVGRYILRMAAEIEALLEQRDALANENSVLKAEVETLRPKAEEPPKPHLVE